MINAPEAPFGGEIHHYHRAPPKKVSDL